MSTPNPWDEATAATYDDSTEEHFHPREIEATVAFLADLAGDSALEFGIGTGRIALPLSRRGVRVAGIDSSQPMVDRLHRKAPSSEIAVVVGDYSTTTVAGPYSLVYLVFNTIENLVTQSSQVECFENAARHLRPGGRFVIEVGVPGLRVIPPGETMRIFWHEGAEWGIDEYDTATQRLTCHYLSKDDDVLSYETVDYRYVWPSEMDLMARIAGMTLTERWGDWSRTPFTHESARSISVWTKGR